LYPRYLAISRGSDTALVRAFDTIGREKCAVAEHSRRSMEQYYAEFPEDDRLKSGFGQLEFERTKIIVQRYLPSPPAVVADVGGGTGPYSFWLASLGYEVHLIDPSERLVQICQSRMQANPSQPCPRTATVGDARSSRLGDATCDAVLMLGPLYHLTERNARVRAIEESRRVLKPGGRLFAATITRVASLVDALSRDLLGDAAFLSIVETDIQTGQHRNPTDDISYFTDTFFHRRAEIRAEVEAGGLEVVAQLPIEGLGILARDFESLWRDSRKRTTLLDMLARTEGIDEVNGASAHYMTVGRKR
jgi:ubiquinone/menaquinone biosynthesis C-methylase UbiE